MLRKDGVLGKDGYRAEGRNTEENRVLGNERLREMDSIVIRNRMPERDRCCNKMGCWIEKRCWEETGWW